MIAVIKGDIISSRKIIDQERWLSPLKKLFGSWGETPKVWELVWGDFFQIEISLPQEAIKKALEIKALIKKIEPTEEQKKKSVIDVRMSVGIGDKSFSGERVSESNGSAFIYAGEKFDSLRQENVSLGIKTPWQDFDEEINLYLRLAETFMNNWSVSSAELIKLVLENPNLTQEDIGRILGIKQSAVSGRWKRAYMDEVLALEKMYRKKINLLLQ